MYIYIYIYTSIILSEKTCRKVLYGQELYARPKPGSAAASAPPKRGNESVACHVERNCCNAACTECIMIRTHTYTHIHIHTHAYVRVCVCVCVCVCI